MMLVIVLASGTVGYLIGVALTRARVTLERAPWDDETKPCGRV